MAASPPYQSAQGSESGQSERKSTGETIPDQLSIEEYGRLYNAYRAGKYFLPNDGEEQDRLDIQHYLWKGKLGGRLYLAPIGEPTNVLDIGTGTGIWARQFAREHPNSIVVGTDLSLIQPTAHLPPNCSFVREDAEEDWMFDKPFDFIHWRLMLSCCECRACSSDMDSLLRHLVGMDYRLIPYDTDNDHKAMIFKVHDHLVPGGWAEFHESAFEIVGSDEAAQHEYDSSPLGEWRERVVAGGAALGKDFQAPLKYRQWMVEAGFTDVVQKQMLTPINGWPLDPHEQLLGKWTSANAMKFVPASTKLIEASGMPLEEIPAFQERVLESYLRESMRMYYPTYVIYGRKALDSLSDSKPQV